MEKTSLVLAIRSIRFLLDGICTGICVNICVPCTEPISCIRKLLLILCITACNRDIELLSNFTSELPEQPISATNLFSIETKNKPTM